jgi:uncharacterized protein (TIGR03435 family)
VRNLGSALLAALLLSVGAAQSPAPSFEVASIKPNTEVGQPQSGLRRLPGGGMNATNVTLRFLITFAYDIRDHQLSGGPAWLDTDHWDVAAKPSAKDAAADKDFASDPNADRLKLRMQSLLTGRFKLAFHRETKEMPVYALVLGKGAPKLELWKEGPGTQILGEQGGITCKKVSMKRFADMVLSRVLGRTVIDKTGLTGEYNFTLRLTPDAPPKPDPSDAAAPPPDQAATMFSNAVQEQLGLKIEAQKGPVEVLVIDHVERASAN